MKRHIIIITLIFAFFFLLCKKVQVQTNNFNNSTIEQKNSHNEDRFFILCTIESRKTDYCIEVYDPVCGWFTQKPSDCDNLYCREGYANQCFACKDKRVVGYTKGKCKN